MLGCPWGGRLESEETFRQTELHVLCNGFVTLLNTLWVETCVSELAYPLLGCVFSHIYKGDGNVSSTDRIGIILGTPFPYRADG